MNSDKKLTKEDTWRPADLRRHLREEGHGDDYVRRRDDGERKQHRGGESTDRRRRDVEKESRQERDTDGRDRQRETDRLKEGSRDRRGDKDRESEKRTERDRLVEGKRHDVDYTGDRRRDRNREEKHDRERDKERHRDKDKERDRDSRIKVDMDKKRDEKDKERRRDDRERESRRHEGKGEGERDRTEKHDREKRDVKDKDRRERQGEREHKEEPRRHKDERERRPKDRGYQDEKQKPVSEVRERRASKGSGEGGTRRHGDRERTERDKLKERTHREEEKKPELNHHRDATGSKKSTADKRNDVKSEVKDEAEQEYEEDFEDYEEDFEELDEGADEDEEEREPLHQEVEEEREEISPQRRKEIEAVQRAMEEENQRVGTAQSRQSTDREEGERPKWSRGSEINPSRASQRRKINFVAAKQREVNKKVAAKQKKRSTELLHMIDLDFSMTFSLLDLPPVNEYDMYIRTFGTANSKQAYVQCNEDNTDRDIQTEEIEVCEKWTQHPPEHNGACGDPNISQEARDKTGREINFDSQRFTAFLHKASQVMVVLLEEDQAETKSLRKMKSQTDTLSFSDGSLQLNTKLPFLYGRHISMVHFSQVQRHTMMSVHSPTTKPSAVRLDSCTIICIWNIWEPSRPQKVLVYESEVQCCCFSPGKAILVFAGTSVGSVVLWDLREHASNHHRLKIGEDEWTFRQPTFSTDAVMGGSGHFSSVTSVEVVPSAVSEGLGPEVPLLASEEESSGLSFQLASLDENGVLNFWVVVELPKANEAGSPTDLGLRPGGKIKLLHSSSLPTAERVSPRDAVKTGPLQTLHLKFRPTDSNHFFIGTNMGLVNHGTSHGLKAPPKFYRFQETGVRPVDVSSIHFSPFMQHLFLVGCGDGSIRLHAVSHEQPVAEWKNGTAGEAVVSVQWAQTRATVFYVLDAASNLHIWDLMKDDAQPVVTERIHSDRVTATTVFGDSGQQNTYSGIALAHESGKIEMQYFTRHFTVPVSAEEEKLESMTTEAF